MFASEKERIQAAFGPELVCIYHVGSTAVPGLAAKPEIDLLVKVSQHREEANVAKMMKLLGYVRGKDLSQGHHFYRRDADGMRTHKVHVCPKGHFQIARMLRFRDLLRADEALRQRYQDLKLQLEEANEHGIKEYLAQKAPFIDSILGPPPSQF